MQKGVLFIIVSKNQNIKDIEMKSWNWRIVYFQKHRIIGLLYYQGITSMTSSFI